jgi:hypothetical protein
MRLFVPQRYILFSLGGLFLLGILFDLKHRLWREGTAIREIIPPFLCVTSILPMLWFLYEAWRHEFVSWWSAGPLLPYSDAAGYLNGAKCLVTFGQLGDFSAFRPLGACLQAAVLALTNQNYQSSLIFLTALTGLATFFAVLETWRAGGLGAAFLYLAFCYLVIFEWVPIFMTETPGYIFASISYVFLLSGFRRRSFPYSLFGLALLIVALSARAGALFTVPLLGIYLIYFFSKGRADTLRKSFAVAAVSLFFLALGPLLLRRVGPEGGQFQGALAYTLYGIAAGGKGWSYVFQVHPELWQIVGSGARSRYAYSLFWEQVTAHPGIFLATIFDAFLFAMENAIPVFYGLVKFVPPAIPAIFALAALILLIPSAWRRNGPWAFLPPMAIGILLSSPFLFDSGFRVYMATIPFHLALAAVAIPLLLGRMHALPARLTKSAAVTEPETEIQRNVDATGVSMIWRWSEVGFAIILLASVTLFPLLASIMGTSNLDRLRQASPDAPDEVTIFCNPSSGVLIEEKSLIPGVMTASFQAILRSPYFAPDLNLQRHMVSGDYLYHALFLPNRADKAYILFDRLPEARPGYLRVHLRLLEHEKEAFLYRAEKFSRLDL